MSMAGHAMSKPIIKSFSKSGVSIITPDGETHHLNNSFAIVDTNAVFDHNELN